MKLKLYLRVCVLACAASACTTEEPPRHEDENPEFTLYVRQSDGVPLVTRTYPSYASALVDAPMVVQVVQGDHALDVVVDVGFCDQFRCTGPLVREELVYTAYPAFPVPRSGFACIGLDGIYAAGVEESRSGACKNGLGN